VTPARLALDDAVVLILREVEHLKTRLKSGDEAAWSGYLETVTALAAIVRETAPEASGRLLKTSELAAAYGVSVRTILRKRKAGKLTAVQLGKRGRAALRWRADGAGGR
jgi:hypothetical protein